MMTATPVNRWTILHLTPKPECWSDIQEGVLGAMAAINTIVRATDPGLAPVRFNVKAMLEDALVSRVEDEHHTLFIHPDVALKFRSDDPDAWPDIIAGMTDTQAVAFKLAVSDDYDITVLPNREDGE